MMRPADRSSTSASRLLSRAALAFLLMALPLWLAACGADDSMVGPGSDTGGFADAVQDTLNDVSTPDTTPTDTTTPDSGPDGDTAADTRDPDTLGETVSPLFSLKSDDRFIVPGNIAEKSSPAVAGSLVAWVLTIT
ncbi:MAG TPA: hypothetical protein PK095_21605, partial [Myxococcota bacterium]|nr:hypothetical protein [Myxococcota bacterium]